MSKIFGTPIQLFNADDPANKTSKDGKESVSSKIKDVLKNLQPLEKAQAALENAAKALDGTAYEEIQRDIQGVVQKITATTQQVVLQLSGNAQQDGQTPAVPAATPGVPTAGQISGKEPLPESLAESFARPTVSYGLQTSNQTGPR